MSQFCQENSLKKLYDITSDIFQIKRSNYSANRYIGNGKICQKESEKCLKLQLSIFAGQIDKLRLHGIFLTLLLSLLSFYFITFSMHIYQFSVSQPFLVLLGPAGYFRVFLGTSGYFQVLPITSGSSIQV